MTEVEMAPFKAMEQRKSSWRNSTAMNMSRLRKILPAFTPFIYTPLPLLYFLSHPDLVFPVMS